MAVTRFTVSAAVADSGWPPVSPGGTLDAEGSAPVALTEMLRIGGEWRATPETFDSIDPWTREPGATLPEAGESDVADAVQAARTAFDQGPWPRMTAEERS